MMRLNPQGNYFVDKNSVSVVKRIIEPIDNTSLNITCDKWFTLVAFARVLQQIHTSWNC